MRGVRWGLLLLVVAVVLVSGGMAVLSMANGDGPRAQEQVLTLCRNRFSREFPAASARNWDVEVYGELDFAKVHADTQAVPGKYGCHLARRGITWSITPESGVEVDRRGRRVYPHRSVAPVEGSTGTGPNGPCVAGGWDC